MIRSTMVSLVMLGVFAGFAAADKVIPEGKNTDQKAKEAKVIKVDSKKNTVIVKMEIDGKEVEKTFKLAEDIEYIDSTGKMATIDFFTSGDLTLIVERDGTITKMKKCDKSDSEKKPTIK